MSPLVSNSPQSSNSDDMISALSNLFNNPIFVNALAISGQSAAAMLQSHVPAQPTHPYAALMAQNAGQPTLPASSSTTTYQQTRSGRISRPPVAPQYNLLQALSAEIDSGTGNFDALLKALSSGQTPGASTSAVNTAGPVADSPSSVRIDPALSSVGVYPHPSQPSTPADNMLDNHGQYATPRTPGENEWTTHHTHTQTLADAAHEQSMSPSGDESIKGDLPAWPLPPGGPGGRKNMPKDEMLARRRARNRVAGEWSLRSDVSS